jgi:hypothetical protein
MPRPRKYSPIKDIILATKIQAYALQLNVEALEKHLLDNPDEQGSYKNELRMTLAYAIRIQKGNGNNAS